MIHLTCFNLYMYLFNILGICILVRMTVSYLIPLSEKGNNFLFTLSLAQTTDEIYHPWFVSLYQ